MESEIKDSELAACGAITDLQEQRVKPFYAAGKISPIINADDGPGIFLDPYCAK